MKSTYYDALKQALNQPAIDNCKLSNDQLASAITGITATLAGYLPDTVRLELVADRAELRATLKRRTS